MQTVQKVAHRKTDQQIHIEEDEKKSIKSSITNKKEREDLVKEAFKCVREGLRVNVDTTDNNWCALHPILVEKMRKEIIWKMTEEDEGELDVLIGDIFGDEESDSDDLYGDEDEDDNFQIKKEPQNNRPEYENTNSTKKISALKPPLLPLNPPPHLPLNPPPQLPEVKSSNSSSSKPPFPLRSPSFTPISQNAEKRIQKEEIVEYNSGEKEVNNNNNESDEDNDENISYSGHSETQIPTSNFSSSITKATIPVFVFSSIPSLDTSNSPSSSIGLPIQEQKNKQLNKKDNFFSQNLENDENEKNNFQMEIYKLSINLEKTKEEIKKIKANNIVQLKNLREEINKCFDKIKEYQTVNLKNENHIKKLESDIKELTKEKKDISTNSFINSSIPTPKQTTSNIFSSVSTPSSISKLTDSTTSSTPSTSSIDLNEVSGVKAPTTSTAVIPKQTNPTIFSSVFHPPIAPKPPRPNIHTSTNSITDTPKHTSTSVSFTSSNNKNQFRVLPNGLFISFI
jgi:hypothetical protein